MTKTQSILIDQFGKEYLDLGSEQREAVRKDFAVLLRDEYDVCGDDTVSGFVERENMVEGVRVYATRIGKGNLASYARCLTAKRK